MALFGALPIFVLGTPPTKSLFGAFPMVLSPIPSKALFGALPMAAQPVSPKSLFPAMPMAATPVPDKALFAAFPTEFNPMADGIDGRQIMTRSIPNDRLILNGITFDEIAVQGIRTENIADGAVTPPKLDRQYVEEPLSFTEFTEILREITGTTPPTSSEIADEDAAVFPDAVTTGGRASFAIPESWNALSDVTVHAIFRNPGPASGHHRIRTQYRVNGGALSSAQNNDIAGPGTTQAESAAITTIPASAISPGDNIAMRVFRDGGDGADTENQDLELYRFVIKVPVDV